MNTEIDEQKLIILGWTPPNRESFKRELEHGHEYEKQILYKVKQ